MKNRKWMVFSVAAAIGILVVWLVRRARTVPETAPAAVRQVGQVAARHRATLLAGAAAVAAGATIIAVLSGGVRTPANAFSGTVCTWTDGNHAVDDDVTDASNWTVTSGLAGACGTGSGIGTASLNGAQLQFPASPPNGVTSLTDNGVSSESPDDIVFGSGYSITGAYGLTLSGTANGGVGIEVDSGPVSIGVPVVLNANQTFEVAAGWSLTVTGMISGNGVLTAGAAGFTGSVVLNSSTAPANLGFTATAGTLTADTALSVGSLPITVDAGATLQLSPVCPSAQTFSDALTLDGTLYDNPSGTGGCGDTWSNSATITLGGAANIESNNAIFTVAGLVTGTGPLTIVGDTSADSVGLADSFNNYTGGTIIQSGGLYLHNTTAAGAVTSGITVDGNASLILDNGTAGNYSYGLTLGSGVGNASLVNAGSSGSSWGGSITLAGTGPDVIADNLLSSTFTVSGTILGAGLQTSAVSGSTIVLAPTSSNSYMGITAVASGTLQLGAPGAYSTGSPLTVAPAAYLDLNGNNATVGGLSGAGTIESGCCAAILTDIQSGSTTFSGNIIALTMSPSLVMNGSGDLTLSAPTSTPNTYTGSTTVQAGTLTLGSLGAASAGTIFTVDAGATLAVNNNGGSPLSFPNSVYLGSGSAGNGVLADVSSAGGDNWTGTVALVGGSMDSIVSSSPSFIVSGLISETGSAQLHVSSPAPTSPLSLTASNSYTSGTVVDAGGLLVSGSSATSALGTGLVTVGDGATLELNPSTPSSFPSSLSLQLGSINGGGTLMDVNGTGDTWAGSISLFGSSGDTIMSSSGNFKISGNISGTALATTGSSSADYVVLAGTNSYTGSTTVASGNLQLFATGAYPGGALTVDTGATLNLDGFSASVSGLAVAGTVTSSTGTPTLTDTTSGSDTFSGTLGGSLSLAMNGTGTLTLSGTGSYSGTATVQQGTLVLASAGAAGTGAITVGDGATLELTATPSSSIPLTLGSTNGGATLFDNASGTGDIWSGTVTLKGSSGDTFKSSTPNFDVMGVISGAASASILGVSGNFGIGWVSFQGNNTYSGGTTVVSGTLSLRYSTAAGTGQVTLGGGTTLNLWGGATSYTFSNSLILGNSLGGAILDDTSNNGNTWSGPITLAGNGDVIESTNTGFQVTNAISSSTGSGLVISPSSGDVVKLSSSDVYAGYTTVSSGTLVLGAAGAIPTTSSMVVGTGATLDLDGFGASVASLMGAGTITSSTGAPTLTDTASGADVFSGPITGSLGLTMQGSLSGTLELSGTCTYTGPTTVTSGTLAVVGSLAGGVTVQANGLLEGSGTIAGAVTAAVSGAYVFPGATSPAVLTTGSVAIETGGQLDIGIDGTSAGSGYSQLVVIPGGTVNISGGALNVSPSFAAPQGTAFDILVNNTGYPVSGTFSVSGTSIPEGGTFTVAGQTYQVTYKGGTSGNDVVLTVDNPPPPPTTPPTTTTSISLSSSASSLAPGSSVTFTATVSTTSTASGTSTTTPDAGASVSFDISSGPDAGKTGSVTTDANGVATYTYTNNQSAGTDMVTATASGASGLASASVTFTGQYSLALSPASGGSDDGTPIALTATLTDPSGNAVTGASVTFTVSAGPDAGQSSTVSTDATGSATFSLDATTTGDDTVSASYTTPASTAVASTTVASNQAVIKWAAPVTIAPTSSPTGTAPGSASNPLLPGQPVTLSVILTSPATAQFRFWSPVTTRKSHLWPLAPTAQSRSTMLGHLGVSHSHPRSLATIGWSTIWWPHITAFVTGTTVPDVGVPVVFGVTTGPDSGKGATVPTDSTGTASWTYTGTGSGTDGVAATFTDAAGVAHTASFAVAWSTTATTTTSSTSSTTSTTAVVAATTTTSPSATTTAPAATPPTSQPTLPPPLPPTFTFTGPVAAVPPAPVTTTATTTSPKSTSTTTATKKSTSTTQALGSHAKFGSTPTSTTALSPQALGVTSNGGVVSVDGVTNNSNGNDVPPAAVKALVAAGQSGPAMPFTQGYGLGAGGGPPGPAPLARSIPTPAQALSIHNIKKTVKSNGLLTFLLIFLIGLPAIAFNSALKEHHASLASSHGVLRRMVDSVEKRLENLHGAVLLVLFAVIGSILYALDDPSFGLNLGSLAEIVGYVGAILVSTTATEVLRGIYVHRRFQKVGDLRAFPLGIVVAIVFDAFSRLSHFEPGYVFGILAAIVFRVKPTGEEDGRSITYASLWLLGLAVVSWVAFGMVNGAVIAGNHTFWLLAAESLLSYVWICGLQSLFFGLIPARYMDGDAVFAWSKIVWAALYLVVTFTFVQFILHPTTSGFGGNKKGSIFPMLAIFIVSAVAGLAFWLYAHRRYGQGRRPGLEVVSVGEG